jgi:hypothetical protein
LYAIQLPIREACGGFKVCFFNPQCLVWSDRNVS